MLSNAWTRAADALTKFNADPERPFIEVNFYDFKQAYLSSWTTVGKSEIEQMFDCQIFIRELWKLGIHIKGGVKS